METIYLVQGDTSPDLIIIIGDKSTNNNIILTGSNVIMKFRKKNTSIVLHTIVGQLINNGVGGVVKFVWPSGALANEGYYEGEIEITFLNSQIQTVYEVIQFNIRKQF